MSGERARCLKTFDGTPLIAVASGVYTMNNTQIAQAEDDIAALSGSAQVLIQPDTTNA
jgi:hypothetical protein